MKNKKHLAGTRCYLSGPIEHGDNKLNWRTEPSRILVEKYNVQVSDPFADKKQQWLPDLNSARERCDFKTMTRISKAFVRKDLAMVDRSDWLVAYLPYRLPTTGTHHEIINSSNARKPTLIVCPEGKQFVPAWYFGFIPPEQMFGGWNELFSYVDDVDDGKHMNDDGWAFVYGLV